MINGLTLEEIKKDPYATHLPVLEEIFKHTGVLNSCLEYGMGLYSTPYLLKNCKYLKSVETDSLVWFDKIKQVVAENRSWDPVCQIGACAELEHIPDMMRKKYDLIFVDGNAASRHVTTQCAQYATSVIVSHDANEHADLYFSVVLRDGWYWIDVKDYKPWTAVVTDQKNLITALQGKFTSTKTYTGTQLKNKECA
jgi:hypothetical protein